MNSKVLRLNQYPQTLNTESTQTVSVCSITPQLGQQEQPPGFDRCPTPFISVVPVRLGFARLHIQGLLD
ncbi:hypothetical protein AOLI_G00101610 [Acnodon oligacanthus]